MSLGLAARAPMPDDEPILIRDAEERDLPAIQQIYAEHVTSGLASFEEVPPDLEEIRRRFLAVKQRRDPYLAAERAGHLAGFAYAGPYRPRPAYRFVREGSLYVAPGQARRGVGRALLGALIEACSARGYRRLIAVIGDSANDASIGLHEALGFRRVGLLPSVGFKFGRWVDSVIMDRPLGEGDGSLPEPRGGPEPPAEDRR